MYFKLGGRVQVAVLVLVCGSLLIGGCSGDSGQVAEKIKRTDDRATSSPPAPPPPPPLPSPSPTAPEPEKPTPAEDGDRLIEMTVQAMNELGGIPRPYAKTLVKEVHKQQSEKQESEPEKAPEVSAEVSKILEQVPQGELQALVEGFGLDNATKDRVKQLQADSQIIARVFTYYNLAMDLHAKNTGDENMRKKSIDEIVKFFMERDAALKEKPAP